MTKILRNRARCLGCGKTIESLHGYDFVSCYCGNLAVDGGTDYIKRSYEDSSLVEELSEMEEEQNAKST